MVAARRGFPVAAMNGEEGRGEAGAEAPAAELQELQRQAGQLYRAGRPAEALATCHELMRHQPGRPDLLAFAGMIALELGDDAQAVELYQAAVARRPDHAEAHYNLGNALKNLDRLQDAAAAYERAVALRPDLAPAHNNLGNALQALGRHAEAEAAYRRTIALAPDVADTHRNLGIVLQRLGREDEAEAAYRRALEILPGWDRAFGNLASLLMGRGDARGAVETCDAWLGALPGRTEALAVKCAALNELGEAEALGVLLDFDRFVARRRFEAPEGFPSLAAFNQALARQVMAHPTLRVPPADHATYHHPRLMISEELMAEPAGALRALKSMILGAIDDYRRQLGDDPRHPFVANWPGQWGLSTWAAVIEGEGQLVPHIHIDGYLGGVYYVQIPEVVGAPNSEHAGWFELGRPPPELHFAAAPTVRPIRPEEGTMLLFPGYMYHRTVPYDSGERRISIAFDLVPESYRPGVSQGQGAP